MSQISWLMSLSPLLALCCNFITQVTLTRLTNNIYLFVFSGVFSGLALQICLLFVSYIPDQYYYFFSYAFACIVTYLALSLCYWGFFNLNRTSLRIRILRELLDNQNAPLNHEALLQIYSPGELLNVRLNRLYQAGKITKNASGDWQVMEKESRLLFLLARILNWFRWLIIPASKREIKNAYALEGVNHNPYTTPGK